MLLLKEKFCHKGDWVFLIKLKIMKKIIVFFLLVALIIVFASSRKSSIEKAPVNNLLYDTKISVGNKSLSVQIVKTAQEIEQGLSDRENLCSNCGMFFVFNTPSIYYFWMPKMHFDLDMLWVSGNKVVDITYDAKKPSAEDFQNPKERYFSKVPVDKVIEVNAGWVKENGIKLGDEVKY